jgi:hypothetical protein
MKCQPLLEAQKRTELCCIFPPLEPSVAANGRNYFHLKCPSLRQSGKKVFPFAHKVTFNGTWTVRLANRG